MNCPTVAPLDLADLSSCSALELRAAALGLDPAATLAAFGLDRPALFSGAWAWCGANPEEWRALVRLAGLPGSAVGELLGIGGRRVREFASGAKVVPWAVWFALSTWCGLPVSRGVAHGAPILCAKC